MTLPDAAEHQYKTQDFTVRREPHRFTIGKDEFAAPAILAPARMKQLAGMHSQLGDLSALSESAIDRAVDGIARLFRVLIGGAGGKLFAERLLSPGRLAGDIDEATGEELTQDDPEPIDLMREALPALYFLLERYGMRPTAPSSVSPTGLTESVTATLNDGTFSTDGASPPATATT